MLHFKRKSARFTSWLVIALNSGLRNLASKTCKHHSIVRCRTHFDTLNRLGMDHQCDRRRDGQDYDSNSMHLTMRGKDEMSVVFGANSHETTARCAILRAPEDTAAVADRR